MSAPGDGSRGRRKGRGRGMGRGRGGQGEALHRRREASGQRPGRQQREREDSMVSEIPTAELEKKNHEESHRPQPSPGRREVREGRVKDNDIPALIPAEEEFKPAPVHSKPPAGSSSTVEGMRRSPHEQVGRRPQEVPSGGASPLVREPPRHTVPLGGASPLVREPPRRTVPSGGASSLVQERPHHTQPTVRLQPDQRSPSSGPLALRGSYQLPKRPGFGTQGRQIGLRANFFPVKFPAGTLYHYDVAIVPGKCPRRINRKVIEAIVSKYKEKYFKTHLPSFDGRKNLYCREELPIGETPLDLEVSLATDEGEKERLFKVAVKLAARVDLECLQDTLNDVSSRMSAVQALDVVFRHTPSMRYESVGRSFFSGHLSKDLGEGREVWFGYFQSLRPTMKWPLALNVDLAATAFYKAQSVLEFLCEQLRLKDVRKPPTYLCDFDRVRFEKEIKGLRIEVTHLPYPRKYRVCGVSKRSASNLTFPLEEQKECTVERYFLEKHKKRLQFPELPCLHVGKKEGHVFIPLELCKVVPGQHCTKKLSDYQTSQMIRYTVQPAYRREEKILQNVHKANFNSDKRLSDLDIAVTNRMVEFTGHILPQPTLTYKQKETTPDTKQGAWDMKGRKFHEGVEIRTWAIVVLPHPRFCRGRGHTCEVEKFVSQLRRTSTELGMVIHRDPEIREMDPREDVERVFRHLCSEVKGLQLIVAVLDDEKGHGSAYNKVKSVGDNLIGIATQCILAQNVKKAQRATISNLCLKINAKLGGVNTIIHPPASIFSEPVIVMGADVTHPAPGDIRKPSIAAVTASMDRYASKYRADCSIQKHRQEIIADLESMTKGLLLEFHHTFRGAKPRRIIFYRDGVSEGQFDDVVVNEVAAIQRACKSLQREDYEPGITFIVVQKRHHTRLFCSNKEDAVGRGDNVPPGTTVDRDITHPTDHDFYLCSHAAIQGTSRPCHYYVLWDDNHLSADDVQMLSYQLCHVFFRCNRSVSYPAPTYYAHHVAFHARALLQNWEDKNSDSVSTASSVSDDHLSQEEMARAVKIKDEIRKNMYFA